MKNTKKILSLALTLVMLLSAIFCTGAVVTAEEPTPAAFSYRAVTHSTVAEHFDWSSLGQNLIPDSTVGEFDSEGNYKVYYGTTDGAVDRNKVVNANAWWSSTHSSGSSTALKGPGVSGRVSNTVSHTNDKTGSIVHDYATTNLDSTYLNMSATDTNAYYLLSFWVLSNSGDSLTFKFMNSSNGLLDSQSNFSTTSVWTQQMFIVSVADTKWSSFMVWSNKTNKIYYIDDIELYKLDGTYAERCISAGKLLNGVTDNANLTAGVKYSTRASATIDFDALGTNLAYDPTVSKFNQDGTYNTEDGIKPFNNTTTDVFSKTSYHTNDGSGAIKLATTGTNYYLSIAPKMDANSYYLVTYYFRAGSWYQHQIRHIPNMNKIDTFYQHQSADDNGNWHRVTYIVYTGSTAIDGAIGIWKTGTDPTYIDDFGVYKLEPKYAVDCINAGALSEPETEGPAALTQSINLFKVDSKTDFEQFGPNLFPDANVSAFDADGVYKDYSADNNAWWSKTTAWKSGGSKASGYITKDATHTADGSGTLAINGHAYLPVPTMEANSYYVLSAWVKDTADGAWTGSAIFTPEKSTLKAQESFGGIGRNAWGRVVYLIRTGDAPLDIVWNLYFGRKTFVDDFELRKIDNAVYAEECIAAGKFTNTNIAEATETVTTTANNQMVNLPEKEGYFIPQGSVLDASGAYAEKLGNGRYFVANAGDVSYTYFRYPAGNVGTFGASVKPGNDTAENEADKSGIQFGSILTDNLSIDASGTLVLRGDFDAFRKSLPNYSREQIIKIIYNNLQRGNVAAGDVATIANGNVKIDAMYVPRSTYMWKNSANTELQYAVRVFGVATNRGDVTYTAVGYTVNDGVIEFSKEIKSATYNGLN